MGILDAVRAAVALAAMLRGEADERMLQGLLARMPPDVAREIREIAETVDAAKAGAISTAEAARRLAEKLGLGSDAVSQLLELVELAKELAARPDVEPHVREILNIAQRETKVSRGAPYPFM